MDEAWKEFMLTGKVTDYLRYKYAQDLQAQAGVQGEAGCRKERPDGTEYHSDRDGLNGHADWRI